MLKIDTAHRYTSHEVLDHSWITVRVELSIAALVVVLFLSILCPDWAHTLFGTHANIMRSCNIPMHWTTSLIVMYGNSDIPSSLV